MEDKKLNIIYKKVEEIKPYKNNPRNNDKAVPAVKASIKEFGFKVPMIIDKDGTIITGHTRFKAALELGYKEVPIIIADDLTPSQIKAFRLADNKVSELADWNIDQLNKELDELLKDENWDKDMDEFGFIENEFETSSKDNKTTSTEQKYTMKVDIPQYQVTGEVPQLPELCIKDKYNELIKEIDDCQTISDDIKDFLKLAATRHISFDYHKIAEYYVDAPKEVQQLMENSALVIIDYEDAIKNGFVNIRNTLHSMKDEDEEDDDDDE